MTRTSPLKSARNSALLALAFAAMSAQAQARVGNICLELPAGASLVKASISSGCLPTHPGYEGSFQTVVDAETATISITGRFEPTSESRYATADCMGARTIEQESSAAGPRRYSVIINGTFEGVIDASDTTYGMRDVKECFESRNNVRIPKPSRGDAYNRQIFRDWIARPKGKINDPLYTTSYATVGEAVAALLGGHPASGEGRPSAEITISQGQWDNRFLKPPTRRFTAVKIEEHGYLDDSVSGKRTFAELTQNSETGTWKVGGHWHQFMCARGDRAGQWSAQPCP